jgi:hypothetical protein
MQFSILAATLLVLAAPAHASVRGLEKQNARSVKSSGTGVMSAMTGMMKSYKKGSDHDGLMAGGSKTYFALLSGAQENPDPCMSAALGNALVTLDGFELCIKLSYSGLSGPEIYSHIHGPAPIGMNAGPAIFVLGTDTVKAECFTLDDDQVGYVEDGLLYFNVHSEMCPSGEIRGQIIS